MPAIDVHRIECCSRPQPYLRQLERLRDDPPLLADQDPWPKRQRTRTQQRGSNEFPPIEGLIHVCASGQGRASLASRCRSGFSPISPPRKLAMSATTADFSSKYSTHLNILHAAGEVIDIGA